MKEFSTKFLEIVDSYDIKITRATPEFVTLRYISENGFDGFLVVDRYGFYDDLKKEIHDIYDEHEVFNTVYVNHDHFVISDLLDDIREWISTFNDLIDNLEDVEIFEED